MVKKNNYAPMLNSQGFVSVDASPVSISKRRVKEQLPTFEEDALDELRTLKSEKRIASVYRSSGFSYIPEKAAEGMRAALAAQDYICGTHLLRIVPCTATAVYARKGRKWLQLWKTERLLEHRSPVFLFQELVQKKLKEVFSFVEMSVGQLAFQHFKAIAWKVRTNEGTYFIPWHNGMLISEDEQLKFEEKELADLKRTYNIMRFSEEKAQQGMRYKIL